MCLPFMHSWEMMSNVDESTCQRRNVDNKIISVQYKTRIFYVCRKCGKVKSELVKGKLERI